MSTAEDRIDTLDLAVVRRKLIMSNADGGYEWPEGEADKAISAYRQFLREVLRYRAGCQCGPGRSEASSAGPAPDPVVDIVWHTHILFTQKYHQDCAGIFGEYIHHRPRLGRSPSGRHNPVEF